MLILIEYAENGSLDKFLQTHEINEGQRLKWAIEICDALEYLHSMVIIAIWRSLAHGLHI